MTVFPFNLFKKKSILIVEDDGALRDILRDRLNAEDFRVLTATNGQEGLVLAIERRPDIILLDLMLPRRDGLSFLKELRKDEWGANAKVIVMSNLMEGVGLTEQTREYKVSEYIEKAHLSLDALVEKVKKLYHP
jgi:DNA-binding response OmpR family regulator